MGTSPASRTHRSRRDLLKGAAWSAALVPPSAAAAALPALPDPALHSRDPEAFWKRIREEQFLLPGWRAFLNNGSLGVTPKPVLAAVTGYLERAAALEVEDYPRWGYETLDSYRETLALFCGCKKDELALVHNATEAMSAIAEGLDLKAGDEVLITDQEHPSGRCCWQRRQARDGIEVREVKLPLPPQSAAQLAEIVISAIGARTRVVSFSGITTTTGLIMPCRVICDAARAKGVLSVVDGAHMNGQIPFRLSDLGCDFFAGSPHKWLFAPAGSGLLYVREEMIDRLWPTIVTGDWDNRGMKAARFMRVGTNNRSILEGLMAGLRFLQDIGPERVYARIHELARLSYRRARALGVDMLSAEDHNLYAAIVAFRLSAKEGQKAAELCRKRRIWGMVGERVRVSTHIHTRPQDIELFFETLAEARRG